MGELVNYKDWTFEVDRLENERLYAEVTLSGAQECNCGACQAFLKNKSLLYPQEIRILLNQLGVDINKEFEVFDSGDENFGHIYIGWFTFAGRMIAGRDCSIPLPQGGYTSDLSAVDDIFKIGFTNKISKSFFNSPNLLEIEFYAQLPWNMAINN